MGFGAWFPKASPAPKENWNTKHDADRAIQRAKSEAQCQVQQIDAAAQQRVSDIEQELATAQKEAEYQRGLNANLIFVLLMIGQRNPQPID